MMQMRRIQTLKRPEMRMKAARHLTESRQSLTSVWTTSRTRRIRIPINIRKMKSSRI